MSLASRLKPPAKKKPDLNKPIPLGFDPTQAPEPYPPPLQEDTLRLYEPAKKVSRRRHKVKYPEPARPEFNKGRL